ncbi:MAG: VWA domain-containing protein [Desulfurococcales archaeon]|nr:VWA domain-containing protein [Desulfurococcales archaeon]
MRQIDIRDQESLASILLELASTLRNRGYRVSTGEVVQAINMVKSYASIMGVERISERDFAMIIAASMPSIRDERAILQGLRSIMTRRGLKELVERLEEQLEERLETLGIKPGQSVSRKSIIRGAKSSRERREKLKAYLELKKAGFIVRKGYGEAVIDQSSIKKRLARIASLGIKDLGEALERREKWDRDSSLTLAETGSSLKPEALEGMDTGSIINLAEAAIAKGNYRLLKESSMELLRRLSQGYRADPVRARNVLRRAGLLTPEAEAFLAHMDHRVVDVRSLEPGRVASLLRDLDMESSSELLSKYLREASPEDARRLLSGIDPVLLWKVKKTRLEGDESKLVEAASDAAKSLVETIRYFETGNEGRLDLASHYAQRAEEKLRGVGPCSIGLLTPVSVERMLRVAKHFISVAEGGDVGRIGDVGSLLYTLDPSISLKLVKGAYSMARGPARQRIEWLLENLVSRVSSREKQRVLPKHSKKSVPPGSVDVKLSVMNASRLRLGSIVYRRKLKGPKVSLALDTSASMSPYAIWAIGVSALFTRSLDKLTLFSSKPVSFDGPFTRRELSRILLGIEFKGYTNIYEGLLEAGESRAQKIVIVSDLAQTIDAGNPIDAANSLLKRGKKVHAIVPLRHDEEVRRGLESIGVRVTIAKTPREAAVKIARDYMRR